MLASYRMLKTVLHHCMCSVKKTRPEHNQQNMSGKAFFTTFLPKHLTETLLAEADFSPPYCLSKVLLLSSL